MPSLVFQAVPAANCPHPYAQYFQRACMRWQVRHDISLPTHAYLANRFGMTSTKVFTETYNGRYIPAPSVILRIARECGDSFEEHLLIANLDLERRGKLPYDSFQGMIRFIEYRMASHPAARRWLALLQMTQESAWLEHRSKWHDRAEEILVLTIPIEQKIKLVTDALEEVSHVNGHAPSSQQRSVARA